MTDPVNGCRYCGKDRRAHAQEQHAGRQGFEAWVEPTDEQRKERLRVRAATPADETLLVGREALAAALYRLEWDADLYATPRGRETERYERRADRLRAALAASPADANTAEVEWAVQGRAFTNVVHSEAEARKWAARENGVVVHRIVGPWRHAATPPVAG